MSEENLSNVKRRLIISYSYKPANNPRAFRWSAIAEYWVKQGYEVDVVCAWKSGLPRQETLNGVHVYRVNVTAIEWLRKLLGKADLHLEKPDVTNVQYGKNFHIKNNFLVGAKKIILLIWKKIYWPDSVCFWFFPAINQAENLLKAHKYEALISVSLPFTGHLVGWRLKNQFPYINWIVDVGDPFSFQESEPINNPQFYKKINYLFERQAFRQADGISVTTKTTLEKYVELFPEIENKIEIIPPLISISLEPEEQLKVFPKTERKIRMVFVGRLYKNIRNPSFLLKLFSNLLDTPVGDRLELHFFGELQDCQNYFLPYRKLIGYHLFVHGVVNHSKAIQAMKESDILVNIGNQTNYQLPSKVVEYVSFKKPIINISKQIEDSSREFLKDYPLALCLLETKNNEFSESIQKTNEFIENLPESTVVNVELWQNPFLLDRVAFNYEQILSKAITA